MVMAEAVGSAVLGEAVNKAVTALLATTQTPEQSECVERLEVAQMKMEAAVEASSRWQITDAPLLRWRKTLKRAAEECDDALRSCKQRAVEDEDRAHELSRSSLPTRIARATKSLISSLIVTGDGDDRPSRTAVRRFERYADGAEEFLRFVHLGGTAPLRPYAFSNPLVGQLLAGEFLQYESLRGGRYRHFDVKTVYNADRGLEAVVSLVYADTAAPMESFYVFMILRLSESVDIIGTAVKTMLSAASRYRPATIDAVMTELTQLPTQDFSWSPPPAFFGQKESDGLHRAFVRRFRPDPFCCMDDRHGSCCAVPEPVVEFFLQQHVSLPHYDLPPLKLQTYIMPHDSQLDLRPAYECCAAEVIDGEEQRHIVHVNVGLNELDRVLLPKAIEYLYRRAEATSYQLVWKSKHGTAHIYLEKTMGAAGEAIRPVVVASKRAFQPQEYVMKTLMQALHDNLKPWVVRSSVGLRDAMLALIQKVNPAS